MTEAADQAELDPDRHSFTRTLHTARRQVTAQAAFPPSRLDRATAEALTEILRHPARPRRHRSGPRVVKRGRPNYYRIKNPGHATTRHPGPPQIRIHAPAA